MNYLDELIEAAWRDYEQKRLTDAPYEYVEAAAETLFVLAAQREGIHLQAERQAETYVAMVEELRPMLQKLWEGIQDIAKRFFDAEIFLRIKEAPAEQATGRPSISANTSAGKSQREAADVQGGQYRLQQSSDDT